MVRVYAAGCLVIVALCALLLAGCGSPGPDGGTASPGVAIRASDTSEPAVLIEPDPGGTYSPRLSPTPEASPGGAAALRPEPTFEPQATGVIPPLPTVSNTSEPRPTLTPEPEVASTAGSLPTATAGRLTPSPTARPVPPQVLAFAVEPKVAENVGDRLRISWRAMGETAWLCPMAHGPVESRCEQVSLDGSREYVTTEESLSYVGFGLKVTTGDQFVWGTQTVHFLCQNLRPWFFGDPPLRCPAAEPVESYAAGQYFERGLMIWREDPDQFYVLCEGDVATFDQRLYIVSVADLAPDASPLNRVDEDPPPGMYEPVSGFGMVWRGELQHPERDFRECLGWATAPEAGYTLVEQCETTVLPGAWACYMRGLHGEILRLAAATNAGYPLVWQVYQP